MSGDVQPRKRKDKKKKKGGESVPDRPKPDLSFLTRKLSSEDEETLTSSKTSTSSSIHHKQSGSGGAEDVEKFHLQKDATTGGHWCAKIIFFILMAALVGLIGLIILENRGLTDLDTQQAESRYAEVFEGWIEEPSNHDDDHHDIHQYAAHDDEDEEHYEDDEDDHNDEDHDEEDDSHGEEEDDHDEEIDDHEEKDDAHGEDDGHDEDEVDDHQDKDDDHDDDDDEEEDEAQHQEEDNVVSEEEALHHDVSEQIDDSLQEDDDETKDDNEETDDNEGVDDSAEQYIKSTEKEDELYVRRVVDDLSEEIVYGKESHQDKHKDIHNTDEPQSNDDEDDADDAPFEEIEDDEIDSKEEQVIEHDDVSEEEAKPDEKDQDVVEEETHTSDTKPTPGNSVETPDTAAEDQNPYEQFAQDFENARTFLDENPSKALVLYNKILEAVKIRKNLVVEMEALLGRAQCLDKLAEIEKSNQILDRAIDSYSKITLDFVKNNIVNEEIFETAAFRCIDRMRFKGAYAKAVPIHEKIIQIYPDDPKHQNDLAVTYLMGNRPAEALRVLHKVLQRWRDNGFALVHYGFIYKTSMNDLQRGVRYLQEGIDTKDNGTMDGRFLFHLGDGLQRLGRNEEAMQVYETGVQNKIFLSRYQRSLYNLDRLISRPFWTIEQTGYKKLFDMLTSNWKAIRDEGLAVLEMQRRKSKENLQNVKHQVLYRDEAENLRDTGDWKQFELYSRGMRNQAACSLAPLTCRLISAYSEASTCTRGQIKFSLMEPGTHVWPHCGPTNCRLRAHLGLKVGEKEANGACQIRVAEEKRSWKEGEIIIFDDSFEHEVWHNGTSTRLVLIVDVWHPDTTLSERRSLSPI